ncbi:MAG: EAL domain-containing protein [Rhodobiaceae bacterium]|nr:EAL domain-containing protein [Rhodobiaceae bacterium]MCC0056474.1 EAL domain-containing protein [Rhodobiaceae bacterium]
MRRKTRKILLAVLLAVAMTIPSVVFYRYVGSYAIQNSNERIGQIGRRMTAYAEQVVDSGLSDMASLVSQGVGECGETARERMVSVLDRNRNVSQIIVADIRGREMCSAFLRRRTSTQFTRADQEASSLEFGRMNGVDQDHTYVGLRQWIDDETTLTFVYAPSAFYLDVLPDAWRSASDVMLRLDDKMRFSIGEPSSEFLLAGTDRYFTRTISSGRFPFAVEIRLGSEAGTRDFARLQRLGTAAMGILSFVIGSFGAFVIFRPPSIDEDLRQAVDDKQFIPFYQPVIDLECGKLTGCEVLARRRMRDGTIISPLQFIDHLEHNGMIVKVTRMLMRQVRADLNDLCRERSGIYISFNLCSLHFRDDRIVRDVKAIFGDSDIRYSRLAFEITERLPLEDLDMALEVVTKLQALGCRVALDDAGTGHAGLAILQQIPFDIIKIDKFFIDTIATGNQETPIIDTIISLGRNLRKIVIAEGVENMAQLSHLRSRGLRFAQGYLFSPPLPPKAFIRLARQLGRGASTHDMPSPQARSDAA